MSGFCQDQAYTPSYLSSIGHCDIPGNHPVSHNYQHAGVQVQYDLPWGAIQNPLNLFIVDNRKLNKRFIVTHSLKYGDPVHQLHDASKGYLITEEVSKWGRSVDDAPMSYSEWRSIVSDSRYGDPLFPEFSEPDHIYSYTWVPHDLLKHFTVRANALPNAAVVSPVPVQGSSALALYPQTLSQVRGIMATRPMDLLFKGVPAMFNVEGFRQRIFNPTMLTYMAGAVAGMSLLKQFLPDQFFWSLVSVAAGSFSTLTAVTFAIIPPIATLTLGTTVTVAKQMLSIADGIQTEIIHPVIEPLFDAAEAGINMAYDAAKGATKDYFKRIPYPTWLLPAAAVAAGSANQDNQTTSSGTGSYVTGTSGTGSYATGTSGTGSYATGTSGTGSYATAISQGSYFSLHTVASPYFALSYTPSSTVPTPGFGGVSIRFTPVPLVDDRDCMRECLNFKRRMLEKGLDIVECHPHS